MFRFDTIMSNAFNALWETAQQGQASRCALRRSRWHAGASSKRGTSGAFTPSKRPSPRASAGGQYDNELGQCAHRHADADEWVGRGNLTCAVIPELCFCVDE